jgi:hypothetical protein
MAALGGYDGEAKRRNAQKIMDAAWMRDAATKPVYVKWVDRGLPVVDDDDEVLYAKYNVKSYHNITGDEIGYLLEFRLEDMKNRPDIKVGSYVYIPNEMNEYEWWLIWHYDDRLQFRQFSIVKCLHEYAWVSIKDGMRVIHRTLGCPRNQSSYNSGVWLDYTMQVIENQHILVMPTNEDSKTIGYDTRFLISDPGRYPPLAWKVSKVSPSLSGDIIRFTMTQEQFDPARDNAELMIGGYYEYKVTPELPELEETPTVSDLEITYSGKPAVRAGGGYKKFTLKSRIDGKLVGPEDEVHWSIDFPDGDINALITSEEGNVFKVKCDKDYSLIGKTFTISAKLNKSSKSIVVEVISL